MRAGVERTRNGLEIPAAWHEGVRYTGWEWHDRRRNKEGQFVPREHFDQIHLRMRHDQADRIRDAAKAQHMEISAFCLSVIEGAMTGNGQPRQTNGTA